MAGRIRVLIVENYAPLRAALAQMVSSWGYEVETASDGLEALGKIPSFDPEVIISSLQMPHMGGMQLLKAVRHQVPCIIISADVQAEEVLEANRLGACSFLEKPVEGEQLHMDLRKCLSHTNTSRSLSEDRRHSQRDVLSGAEVAPMPGKRR